MSRNRNQPSNALMVREERYRPNATPVERALVKALRAERRRSRRKRKQPPVTALPPEKPFLRITYTHTSWSNSPPEPYHNSSLEFLAAALRFLATRNR